MAFGSLSCSSKMHEKMLVVVDFTHIADWRLHFEREQYVVGKCFILFVIDMLWSRP